MKAVVICTGNTCRSPMAAALLRRALDKRGRSDIIVESAGLAADGSPASANAVAVMEEEGLDISAHRSRQADAALFADADLVAVMSPAHAMGALSLGARPETIRILGRESGGIADPYGGDREIYRKTRDQLKRAVEPLAEELCAREAP